MAEEKDRVLDQDILIYVAGRLIGVVIHEDLEGGGFGGDTPEQDFVTFVLDSVSRVFQSEPQKHSTVYQRIQKKLYRIQ